MIDGPVASKILSIDRKLQCSWVELLYFVENIIQFIMKLRHEIPGIVERLVEELARILAWNGDILRQEISSPAVTHTLSIEMDRKIGPMDFL